MLTRSRECGGAGVLCSAGDASNSSSCSTYSSFFSSSLNPGAKQLQFSFSFFPKTEQFPSAFTVTSAALLGLHAACHTGWSPELSRTHDNFWVSRFHTDRWCLLSAPEVARRCPLSQLKATQPKDEPLAKQAGSWKSPTTLLAHSASRSPSPSPPTSCRMRTNPCWDLPAMFKAMRVLAWFSTMALIAPLSAMGAVLRMATEKAKSLRTISTSPEALPRATRSPSPK
mmetsp:Transcript_8118/g.24304  ORF Transcript_8118/g.24304 Transcript_8118/m.24304 type:complete len:227 (+) Transcript_8118:60-740(+)